MGRALEKVKDDKGNLCYVMSYNNKEILVDVDDYKEALNLGIKYKTVKEHASRGRRSLKNYIKNFEHGEVSRRLAIEDREREERRLARIEAKQRKEQERLQMIEDAKCRSKWFEHLAENDIFPKVVK
ncbi:hypothetical protein ACWEYY_00290 [Staphylococcus xylosus]